MNEHFQKGHRQAKRVAEKEPQAVSYWLARARRGRQRWKTRLFDWKKRRFLEGFIVCLEEHLKEQDPTQQPLTKDLAPGESDIDIETTGDWSTLDPESAKRR